MRDATPIRLAIVTMTKAPVHFEWWLAHHRKLGVVHFYVRVEDADPLLADRLRRQPDVTVVWGAGRAHYEKQQDRQVAHANAALRAARACGGGVTHLLHVDDDELLACPQGLASFHKALREARGACIHLANHEALLPHGVDDVHNPFVECHRFETNPARFRAYANGKAIAVVHGHREEVHCTGPHAFSGSTSTVPDTIAVVRHYESLPFERYLRKFRAYARCTDQGATPFPFYNESIAAGRRSASDEEFRSIWRRWLTR